MINIWLKIDCILSNVKNLNNNVPVGVALQMKGNSVSLCGEINVKTVEISKKLVISNALFLTGLKCNLLSMSQIEKKGFIMHIANGKN